MDFDQRVAAVAAAERFQNDPTGVNEDSREEQDSTAAQILLGREELPNVSITDDQVCVKTCVTAPQGCELRL